MKNSMVGVSNSLSKVTGTFAKGVSKVREIPFVEPTHVCVDIKCVSSYHVTNNMRKSGSSASTSSHPTSQKAFYRVLETWGKMLQAESLEFLYFSTPFLPLFPIIINI